MSGNKTPIAVAKGDGIGPEIMDAALRIFEAAKVPLEYRFIDMGKSIFDKGESTGMTDKAKATIEETGILYKGPMETPKGKGVKSINVTARKVWNTYANVRKFRAFKGVDTIFSKAGIPINLTVLRENIEDTYGGIEYMHSYDVAVSYRLISRPGSEQFLRFVFEYAKREGIKQVTCGHKANIMKLTDGMFLSLFYQLAKEYPEIQANDLIVDDLAMKLVRWPERFGIIAMTNLQGDIISDLCAGLVGGLGFAPSANVGDNISIFEAVHGTAPDIAGKKLANPTSLLLSGLMMLRHLGLISYADTIENALLYTLEQGVHTGDFGDNRIPSKNTDEFTEAIVENLGQKPAAASVNTGTPDFRFKRPSGVKKIRMMTASKSPDETIKGADVFIECNERSDELAKTIKSLLPETLRLQVISNRGTQVWPESSVYTDSIGHYCVRLDGFQFVNEETILKTCIKFVEAGLNIADIVFLKEWGDTKGFSLAQGQ
jgi:isocitrate dehydrogenase